MRVLCSSQKPMRKTPVSRLNGALLSLSHARKRRALRSRLVVVLKTCACADNWTTVATKPVSSTSRRGARAAYHHLYPRDFGSGIAFSVTLVSATSRHPTRKGGIEISAPRPYETYPFHPPVLFTTCIYEQLQHIY